MQGLMEPLFSVQEASGSTPPPQTTHTHQRAGKLFEEIMTGIFPKLGLVRYQNHRSKKFRAHKCPTQTNNPHPPRPGTAHSKCDGETLEEAKKRRFYLCCKKDKNYIQILFQTHASKKGTDELLLKKKNWPVWNFITFKNEEK